MSFFSFIMLAILPVLTLSLKIVPISALSPIFLAIIWFPRGVLKEFSTCPSPKNDDDIEDINDIEFTGDAV